MLPCMHSLDKPTVQVSNRGSERAGDLPQITQPTPPEPQSQSPEIPKDRGLGSLEPSFLPAPPAMGMTREPGALAQASSHHPHTFAKMGYLRGASPRDHFWDIMGIDQFRKRCQLPRFPEASHQGQRGDKKRDG